ncbi:hypothetical protein Trydic_g17871 [Trypoxylus dichotomus]
MSDETLGAGQGALPPREDSASRPAVRYAQVSGGQYIFTQSPHNIPAIQITGNNVTANAALGQGGVTRIINISPVRNQVSSIRPSLTNQSIVNALTKPRTNSNIRVQIYSSGDVSPQNVTLTNRSPVKRSLPSTPEKRDTYSTKLQRVMNHRNVRSKIVKEKHNEHLLECHFLEMGGNILDLYQYAKRPKTQQFLNYLKENALDPKEHVEESVQTPTQPTHSPIVSTPSATSVSSLPGISQSSSSATSITSSTVSGVQQVAQNVHLENPTPSTPKTSNNSNKNKSSGFPIGTNQEQIVEKAKQEAYVVQRISDLQKEGLWSEKRLPKVQELARPKAHWDFLLEEMVWLAADFAQERKWKKAAAKKCARMVQKYFQDKALAAQKAERAQEQHIRRIAAFCAKEVKTFWSNVEKLVEYKQNTRLEEKRKKALDQHLSFIVDQTEKYSLLLAEGMNKTGTNTNEQTVPASNASSRSESRANSDDEFCPDSERSTDDEETIAQEEAANNEGESDEVAALQRESEMDFEAFLNELPKDYLQNRDKIRLREDEHSEVEENETQKEDKTIDKKGKKKDDDFVMDVSSEEDDEDTIKEQEEAEGAQDHQQEIDDLQAENEMSIEELRKKYANLPSISEDTVMSTSSTEEHKQTEGEEDCNEGDDGDVEISSNGGSDDEEASKGSDQEEDEDNEDEADDDEDEEIGLKLLLDRDDVAALESQNEGEEKKTDNNDLINDAAAIAESIQPKGNTLSSTSVVTPVPFLLKLPLREYQHIGLDWLVTMFERKLNGILADEMGLGKTIQTIALLAHLACEKENWGPHLIIVPTSVMLNWEMECKKWCPAFKILTYYGTQKERKLKRTGWTKPNAFHICITSYKLVIQDHQSFRRKKWKYLILDEAQNIKNFKSQRWQLLLNFQTQQRLLLTGTPLQNNLMELWSLMHFLMPNVFQSHREFKEWFSNPVTGMIEGNSEYNESIIKRLHKVLRPFLLRRLKSEVEKQMPKKYEHIVMCRLSKRQRFLYDDYMSRAKTKETLASGNLLSVINVLMQLRKVCNHPNLFEVRPTISPFHCEGIVEHIPSIVYSIFEYDPFKHISLESVNLNLLLLEFSLSAYQCYRMRQYQTPKRLIEEIVLSDVEEPACPPTRLTLRVRRLDPPKEIKAEQKEESKPVNSNVKLKVGPGVQFIQQGIQVSQASTSQSPGANLNLSSVLKSTDKLTVQTAFAQLVQTSTGKHILFTPSSFSTSNLGNLSGNTTVMTTDGQRLLLSQSPSTPTNNQQQTLAKAVVKVQLNPVSAVAPPTMNSTSEIKFEDRNNIAAKTVNSKYLEKLYANQNSKKDLDVRWCKQTEDKKDSQRSEDAKGKLNIISRINSKRCNTMPLYGQDFRDAVKVDGVLKKFSWSNGCTHCSNVQFAKVFHETTNCLMDLVHRPADRIEDLREIFNRFIVYVPAVHAPEPELQVWNPPPSTYWGRKEEKQIFVRHLMEPTTLLHPIASAMVTQFPDPRLIQYDCGKLQTLDKLLRKLKSEGHRVLIFTQMTKMLDVLEAFLNFHGHIYLRLDGTTKVDQRQMLMERFNGDKRLFAFILSTRSGGIGVNLTGADTVIFYDSDWNPTMDAQAQDRCHRIGQTRDVHIYRLISEKTIEENILKKANQKRLLGDLAIEGGNFTTAYFKSSTIQDLFNIDTNEDAAASRMSEVIECSNERERQLAVEANSVPVSPDDKAAMGALENALAACEDDQDVQAARTAKAEAVADLAEFDENIPLEEQEKEKEPEISKAEQEVENLIKQLTPIERYAMRFIEETEAAWSAEQLAAAEREIEEKKLEWERNRLAAMKEEEERRARELEEENELLTFSREDATNQVSNKTKKAPRDRDFTPTVRRLNRKSVNRSSSMLSRTERLNNRRHYSTRKSVHRQSLVNKVKVVEDEVEETTNDSKSSIDDIKSELDHSCEDEKVISDNQIVNFDADEGSLDSEADSFKTSNHVDHNSPRTRSRGTVAIDLWTLDINPVLPGVKPIKSSTPVKRGRRRRIRKDSESTKKSDSNKSAEKSIKKVQSDSENEKVDNKNDNKKHKIVDNENKDNKGNKKAKLDHSESAKIEKSPKRTRANVEVQKNFEDGLDVDNTRSCDNKIDEVKEDGRDTNAKSLKTNNEKDLPKESEPNYSDSNDSKSDLSTKRKLRKDDKVEIDDQSKKIKKKNGNKDIQLQESVEKLMNDDSNLDQTEDEVLAATIAEVIEETDKNGKVGIDNNKNAPSKTLKVMLSTRDIDKYLHTKDGDVENHASLENNIENSPNSPNTPVVNHDNTKSDAQQSKNTTTLFRNSKRFGSSPKTVKKTVDVRNSTLDTWLLKSPTSNNDAITPEVDSISSIAVQTSKVSCESDNRTSSSNCDELTVNESEKQ